MSAPRILATNLTAEYEDLAEYLGEAWQQYGDLNAEYRGEIARFGDAWPGSAIQVRGMYEALMASERRMVFLEAVLGRGLVQGPQVPAAQDDEPF